MPLGLTNVVVFFSKLMMSYMGMESFCEVSGEVA